MINFIENDENLAFNSELLHLKMSTGDKDFKVHMLLLDNGNRDFIAPDISVKERIFKSIYYSIEDVLFDLSATTVKSLMPIISINGLPCEVELKDTKAEIVIHTDSIILLKHTTLDALGVDIITASVDNIKAEQGMIMNTVLMYMTSDSFFFPLTILDTHNEGFQDGKTLSIKYDIVVKRNITK